MGLICFHKWQYRSNKKQGEKSHVQCVKCGKITFKKIDPFKVVRKAYLWCPVCENDLMRDSFVKEEKIIDEFKCTECGQVTQWDMTSYAPRLLTK